MKNLLKGLFTLVFALSLTVSAFAFEANTRSGGSVFATNESITLNAFGNIPASVLDPNFTEWQPPRPVPLIPADINDVMMTNGINIFYNPRIVNQLPRKITAFILAHEYGHIYGRTSNEFASDQFAAQTYARTDISVVKAAVWHMQNMQGNQCDPAHGCGWQRAINIASAAGFSEAEYKEIIRGNF